MFDLLAIWSIRYCDMLFASDSPRTTRVTDFAWLAKNMAAWPAEFPAPMRCTSSPCVTPASLRAAP